MLSRIMPAVFAAGLVVSVTPAIAEDAPDLTGKWTGVFTGGVRFGGGDLAPADETPTFVHPEGRPEYTLTIEKQEGRGLMGTWGSVDGSGNHPGCDPPRQYRAPVRRRGQLLPRHGWSRRRRWSSATRPSR